MNLKILKNHLFLKDLQYQYYLRYHLNLKYLKDPKYQYYLRYHLSQMYLISLKFLNFRMSLKYLMNQRY